MTSLLIKLFVKNKDNVNSQTVRSAYVTTASVTGILLNILLFISKLIFGIISGSVAIIADAFNNIADAGSSVVSFVGFKISTKHVDKKHPFGHGRMEYVTSFIVDMIIILVGFELFKSSIERIFSPEKPSADLFTIVILVVSVFVKFWMFFFYRKIGKKISSEALKSAAIDSISDCGATALVLASVIISRFSDVVIDGYVGIIVAALIMFAGIKSAKEIIDLLLGAPPSDEFIQSIYDFVKDFPEIVGIHDIMVHDYGVGRKIISFHAEIPSDYNINIAHEIIDDLERKMHDKFAAIVTIHLDPLAVNDSDLNDKRLFAIRCMSEVDERFTLHDFRMTKGDRYTNLIFDLVIPVDYEGNDEKAAEIVAEKIKENDPSCFAVIKPEHPFH